MKYIKILNIDFDQWDKLNNNSGWHNIEFVKGKTIDYYKKKYPEGTKVRIRKDSIYYYNDYIDVSNPKDIIGYLDYYNNDIFFLSSEKVIKISDYIFHVKWTNNNQNSYRIIDLEYYMDK